MMAASLLYGQNWEDSAIELAALKVGPDDRVIAVGGAGCTVLSLLAQRPRLLYAVDRNAAQLHLLRLKLAAVCQLPPGQATAFLGGTEDHGRLVTFQMVARCLDADTAQFWSAHSEKIKCGVISQGRVERYFAVIRRLLRLIHSRRRTEQVFEQPSLEAQRCFYRDHWDTFAWRALFALAHKRLLDRVLDPEFYQYVDGRGLPRGLRERAERCMTTLPVGNNYFLSWILRGRYGSSEEAWPEYLKSTASASLRAQQGALHILQADLSAFLRTQPDSSADKLYLSNVSEWLSERDLGPFFTEVARVARDGATVCYRALMADRPLPESVLPLFEENSTKSAQFAARDRAFINVGFHVLTVRKGHSDVGA
jgi:S-adenosylmethionine-diacylglycerol 3-amino-3-carboxypropyl transferase